MKKIRINCIEMIREIRDQLFLENRNKTDQEKIEFISSSAKEFEDKIKKKMIEKKLKVA